MALKWAWAFTTDQDRIKLGALGWNITSFFPNFSTTARTYAGDAVTNRASLEVQLGDSIQLPNGLANTSGWVCCSVMAPGVWYSPGLPYGIFLKLYHASAAAGIQIQPATTGATISSVKLILNGVYKATSATAYSTGTWYFFAVKYDVSGSTYSASVYESGVEIISPQTESGPAFTDAAGTAMSFNAAGGVYNVSGILYDAFLTYDDVADAGETVVYCSVIEPTGDDLPDTPAGGWTKTGGSTNHSVVAPWDTATYTKNGTPAANDQFLCTYPSIGTYLGITPTVHAIVSQVVATGGGDVKALFDDGTPVEGDTVTTNSTNPTYAYGAATSGLSASTTIKIGVKIP